ncbi:hypothetical protein CVT24_009644 [Panaeolus cyanescens]|uniref:Uncharacterized protein n=1 Tax=Panaeolus cyanescens TaxID=181874 RepID=A0A409Y9V4_9AGAR|nr:hypothetical protein CVT24_009644 [Panaeolus cyanescens]
MTSFHSIDTLVKHIDNIPNAIVALSDEDRRGIKKSLIDDLTSATSEKLLIPTDKIPEIMLNVAWGFVKIPVAVGGDPFDHKKWEEQHQVFLKAMQSMNQSVVKVRVHNNGLYHEILPRVFSKDSKDARRETRDIIDYHLAGINTFLSEWDTKKSSLSGVLAGLKDGRFSDSLKSKEELLEVLQAMHMRVSDLAEVSDWMREIIYTVKATLEHLQRSYDREVPEDIRRDALKLITDYSKFLFILDAF